MRFSILLVLALASCTEIQLVHDDGTECLIGTAMLAGGAVVVNSSCPFISTAGDALAARVSALEQQLALLTAASASPPLAPPSAPVLSGKAQCGFENNLANSGDGGSLYSFSPLASPGSLAFSTDARLGSYSYVSASHGTDTSGGGASAQSYVRFSHPASGHASFTYAFWWKATASSGTARQYLLSGGTDNAGFYWYVDDPASSIIPRASYFAPLISCLLLPASYRYVDDPGGSSHSNPGQSCFSGDPGKICVNFVFTTGTCQHP